jgi:hypothetical protein
MSYEKVAKMSTPKEPDCCRWTTLLPFIEAEIPRTEQTILQFYRELAPEDAAAIAPHWQFKLQALHWYLPLAREMLCRPAVQSLVPILSLNTLRLMAAPHPEHEFAWIEAVGENRFRLSRVKWRGSLNYDRHPVCDGNVDELAAWVEEMIVEGQTDY